MFVARQHARLSLAQPLRRTTSPNQLRLRPYATGRMTNDLLEPSNDLSQKLKDTGLWLQRGTKRNVLGDKHRVNIVNQGLCGEFVHTIP